MATIDNTLQSAKKWEATLESGGLAGFYLSGQELGSMQTFGKVLSIAKDFFLRPLTLFFFDSKRNLREQMKNDIRQLQTNLASLDVAKVEDATKYQELFSSVEKIMALKDATKGFFTKIWQGYMGYQLPVLEANLQQSFVQTKDALEGKITRKNDELEAQIKKMEEECTKIEQAAAQKANLRKALEDKAKDANSYIKEQHARKAMILEVLSSRLKEITNKEDYQLFMQSLRENLQQFVQLDMEGRFLAEGRLKDSVFNFFSLAFQKFEEFSREDEEHSSKFSTYKDFYVECLAYFSEDNVLFLDSLFEEVFAEDLHNFYLEKHGQSVGMATSEAIDKQARVENLDQKLKSLVEQFKTDKEKLEDLGKEHFLRKSFLENQKSFVKKFFVEVLGLIEESVHLARDFKQNVEVLANFFSVIKEEFEEFFEGSSGQRSFAEDFKKMRQTFTEKLFLPLFSLQIAHLEEFKNDFIESFSSLYGSEEAKEIVEKFITLKKFDEDRKKELTKELSIDFAKQFFAFAKENKAFFETCPPLKKKFREVAENFPLSKQKAMFGKHEYLYWKKLVIKDKDLQENILRVLTFDDISSKTAQEVSKKVTLPDISENGSDTSSVGQENKALTSTRAPVLVVGRFARKAAKSQRDRRSSEIINPRSGESGTQDRRRSVSSLKSTSALSPVRQPSSRQPSSRQPSSRQPMGNINRSML